MLDLWTTLWGNKVIAYLDIMLPSLLQPGNIPAARAYIHTYTFYTNDETRARIEESPRYAELKSLVEVVWEPLQKGEWEVTSNTVHRMMRSADEGHYMYVCSPDDIVGNESLKNLVPLCDGKMALIEYHLPRVRKSAYDVLKSLLMRGTISNRHLVSLTLTHLWRTVSRYPIIPNGDHYDVWHPTPTPIILPDRHIAELFATNWGKNWGYDNCLPYIMIEEGYPWMLIPHSDIYFHIEVGVSSSGPGGVPMNSPCCTWKIEKAMATVHFFTPHRYPNKGLGTIWQPDQTCQPLWIRKGLQKAREKSERDERLEAAARAERDERSIS